MSSGKVNTAAPFSRSNKLMIKVKTKTLLKLLDFDHDVRGLK